MLVVFSVKSITLLFCLWNPPSMYILLSVPVFGFSTMGSLSIVNPLMTVLPELYLVFSTHTHTHIYIYTALCPQHL